MYSNIHYYGKLRAPVSCPTRRSSDLERIKSYLRGRTRELGQAPSETEVRAWCGDQMGCVSLLRRAAGLAKIPAAADYISDWVEATSHQGAERSEEHTSELQSRGHLVCRLLLEAKYKKCPKSGSTMNQ